MIEHRFTWQENIYWASHHHPDGARRPTSQSVAESQRLSADGSFDFYLYMYNVKRQENPDLDIFLI
jgi:hypothetical protein